MENPTDFLLLKIYDNFKWGEPYKAKEHESDPESIHQLTEAGLIHLRYWPEPVIKNSMESCSFSIKDDGPCPENIFDLLGVYRTDDPSKEGEITLYEECIKEFGLFYYEQHGKIYRLARQNCINMVREIVLWHELGHWIAHWMPDPEGRRWKSAIYNVYDHRTFDVHEGLAQLFCYYAIICIPEERKRSEMLVVFDFMLKGQAKCYYKHLDILSHKYFSWQKVFDALIILRRESEVENLSLEAFLEHFSQ